MEPRNGCTLIVRIGASAAAITPALRREVAQAHAGFRVNNIEPQTALVERQMIRERLLSTLSLFFATLALLLAAIGLYGVLNYSVTQQRKEIGIRMALGARSVLIVQRIAMSMLGVVVLGAAIGLIAGLGAGRFVQTLLFDVKATDAAMVATPIFLLLGAGVLAAFHAQDGCAGDGHGSTRTWLRWQTRISGGAASDAIGWMRRLSAHPAVAEALRSARVSQSWARHICEWTDLLPAEHRDGADVILLAAAATGAELSDLERLAEEIRAQTARPDRDGDDGFDDRSVYLGQTLHGAGKLRGDLTPQCAAALSAVLDALGKRAGPEDLRTSEEILARITATGAGYPAAFVGEFKVFHGELQEFFNATGLDEHTV